MSIKRCTDCGTYFDTIGDILDHTCPETTTTDNDTDNDTDPDAIADGGTKTDADFDATTKLRLEWYSGDVHIRTEPLHPERARELQRLLQTATVTLEDGNQRPLVDGHVIEPMPVDGDTL